MDAVAAVADAADALVQLVLLGRRLRVASTPDVYEKTLYSLPQSRPDGDADRTQAGSAELMDNYEYPPPFLLAPRALGLVTTDFWGFRRLWFGLNLGFVLVVAVLVARRLDDRLGTHAVWLTPFVIAGPAIIATFQVGNVQMAMIALAALAMYLRRPARPRARRGSPRVRDSRQAVPGGLRPVPAAAARVARGRLDRRLRRRCSSASGRRRRPGSRTAPSCTRCPA